MIIKKIDKLNYECRCEYCGYEFKYNKVISPRVICRHCGELVYLTDLEKNKND